jgi:hypothetical protein
MISCFVVVNDVPVDHDDSMNACRPDSLAIEPAHSNITADTTHDIAAMSTTPVAYGSSVVDIGSELQVIGDKIHMKHIVVSLSVFIDSCCDCTLSGIICDFCYSLA